MSSNSTYGRESIIPASEIATDKPLSARKMGDVMNNLQYYLDASAQHRINWCKVAGGGANVASASAYSIVFTTNIPWSFMEERRPFAPYVCIAGQATSGTLSAIATLSSAGRPKSDVWTDVGNSIQYFAGNTLNTYDSLIIDGLTDWSNKPAIRARPRRRFFWGELDDAGATVFAGLEQPELRFTLWCQGLGSINHVLLREYCL